VKTYRIRAYLLARRVNQCYFFVSAMAEISAKFG
jgi:hypothetical protein